MRDDVSIPFYCYIRDRLTSFDVVVDDVVDDDGNVDDDDSIVERK